MTPRLMVGLIGWALLLPPRPASLPDGQLGPSAMSFVLARELEFRAEPKMGDIFIDVNPVPSEKDALVLQVAVWNNSKLPQLAPNVNPLDYELLIRYKGGNWINAFSLPEGFPAIRKLEQLTRIPPMNALLGKFTIPAFYSKVEPHEKGIECQIRLSVRYFSDVDAQKIEHLRFQSQWTSIPALARKPALSLP